MSYFLDTNVCVDLLRGKSRGRTLPALELCQVSSIVAAELWTGAEKSERPEQNRKSVTELLGLFELVFFDSEAAKHYGEIRSSLEKAGAPIGPLDQLIAAQARSRGATLLTANLAEFKRVPRLKCRAWA
jgi:tRNA(fMet)-specific endonuclease VapC